MTPELGGAIIVMIALVSSWTILVAFGWMLWNEI